jgi:large conductance mechanosensitive channel
VIDFTIVAFVIFMVVKQINRFKKEAEVTTKECPKCISAIAIAATRCPCCTSEL